MACLHPITIKNKRYEKMDALQLHNYCVKVIGKENCFPTYKGDMIVGEWYDWEYKPVYSYIPPDLYLKVPCGKCAECLKSRRLGWSVRLILESRSHSENVFLTLTLDDEYLKKFEKTPKRPLQLYIDRLRKHLGYRPKYFFIPELGEKNGRLHYHGIIFDTSKSKLPFDLARDKWDYGHAFTGYCNDKTCNYVVKYLMKGTKGFKPFIMCSNGIGECYVKDKSAKQHYHINGFDFRDFIRIGDSYYPLPVYYRNKLYDDDIKVIKMVNRVFDTSFDKTFNGYRYTDPRAYDKAVTAFYEWTLRTGLSEPLPPYRDIIGELRNAGLTFECNKKIIVEQLKLF